MCDILQIYEEILVTKFVLCAVPDAAHFDRSFHIFGSSWYSFDFLTDVLNWLKPILSVGFQKNLWEFRISFVEFHVLYF